MRDAEISLASAGQKSSKTNTGIVPLINFHLAHNITSKLILDLDGEGLYSPYGRAADALLSLIYNLNDTISLKGGYRILEGGSDGDEVYTFALIHYLVLGGQFRF